MKHYFRLLTVPATLVLLASSGCSMTSENSNPFGGFSQRTAAPPPSLYAETPSGPVRAPHEGYQASFVSTSTASPAARQYRPTRCVSG